MFAGGYWGNTGTGGQVTYIPLAPLEADNTEESLMLDAETVLTLETEEPLALETEKTVEVEDGSNTSDLTV